jgi:hypothetical protein
MYCRDEFHRNQVSLTCTAYSQRHDSQDTLQDPHYITGVRPPAASRCLGDGVVISLGACWVMISEVIAEYEVTLPRWANAQGWADLTFE